MLIRQMANGDTASFEKFYCENINLIYGYLKLRFTDDDQINDIVQETFLAVWRNSKQYKENSKAASWVIGIARNKMMDALREQYKKREDSLDAHSNAEHAVQDFSDIVLERVSVQNALQLLGHDARELIYLVFNAGMSYKEAGDILDIPEGTVKSRMYNIKNQLKKKLV